MEKQKEQNQLISDKQTSGALVGAGISTGAVYYIFKSFLMWEELIPLMIVMFIISFGLNSRVMLNQNNAELLNKRLKKG